MYLEIAFRYLHFISIFAIAASIVSEHLMLKPQMSRNEILKLSKVDTIYGISAITLLIAGMTLWMGVGKPTEFYSENWIFHLKLGLFVLLGLLSIYPTVFFMKNRKGENMSELIDMPPMIKTMIRLELLLLLIMPFLAGLMAKGIS